MRVAVSFVLIGFVLPWSVIAGEIWSDAERKELGSIPLMSDTFVKVAKKVQPGIVYISTTQEIKKPRFERRQGRRKNGPPGFENFDQDDFFEFFFGQPREQRQAPVTGLGSGFVINEDGYIVTNNHVVEKADKIIITLVDDKEYDARVIGVDPKTDIALLKIEAKRKLPYLYLGDSDGLRVGDVVIAVGNPFGLDHTVTQGIVSQKERTIGFGQYDEFIQTDASINPGNSGGPLLDIDGDVIGINAAIKGMNTGIGFAIPINLAKNILGQLKTKGKVQRGLLGVYIQKITQNLKNSLGLPSTEGALVGGVIEGSPADKSGFKQGDVIIEFDGKKVTDSNKLPVIVAHTKVGKKVAVVVIRDGKEKEFSLTLDEMKDEEVAESEAIETKQSKLGLEVKDLTPHLSRGFGLNRDERGVVVTDVDQGSAAGAAGLQQGDLIIDINKQKINSERDYERVVSALKKGDSVLFLVKRGEGTLFIAFTLE